MMLENVIGRAPVGLILFCTILAFAIPYGFYKLNTFLHKQGDPPWKKQEESKK